MRIGTWNLAGRWDGRQARLMEEQRCDAWLITEMSERLGLAGYYQHATTATMTRSRRWAAVLTRKPLVGHTDPHPASALATAGGWLLCSSILPWRSCRAREPWEGTRHADKTKAAVGALLSNLPKGELIWGGDWNHALSGREYAGSQEGRRHIRAAIACLGLEVPTASLPHRLPDLLTIDHIAIPTGTEVASAQRVVAISDGKRLSDHDAYVVELG